MTKCKSKGRSVEDQLATLLPAGVKVSIDAEGKVNVTVDPTASPDKFRALGGAEHVAANVAIVNQALGALPQTSRDLWTVGTRVAGALALLREMRPTDGIEGMICAQAIAIHLLGMEAARRAQVSGQPADMAARLRKDAANMARTFAEMLSALDRKRGKGGHQLVRVERVLVSEGGAIIGNVGMPALGPASAPLRLAAEAMSDQHGGRG